MVFKRGHNGQRSSKNPGLDRVKGRDMQSCKHLSWEGWTQELCCWVNVIMKSGCWMFTRQRSMKYYTFFQRTLRVSGREIERRLKIGNMTTATQPGVKPGTSCFPGDCSTSEATGPGPTLTKSQSYSLHLQLKECQVTHVFNRIHWCPWVPNPVESSQTSVSRRHGEIYLRAVGSGRGSMIWLELDLAQ